MIMEALAKGWRDGARLVEGDPPHDGNPFAIYGQCWGAERLIPQALRRSRPFYQIDNGYWRPGRGSPSGYYRICYRSLTPVYLQDGDSSRAASTGVTMAPWRRVGRHILLAIPGGTFGVSIGLDMEAWVQTIRTQIRKHSQRPIVVRERGSAVALAAQLSDCWALVTHSSAVAVEAVIAGVPVFVAPTSAAAPVGNLDLSRLENPAMPGHREVWWASLMDQQFTPAEMASGLAFDRMIRVREQVDAMKTAV